MKKKLNPLLEAVPFEILETKTDTAADGVTLMTVRGVMQKADELNGNGRIYPAALLQREVSKLAERLNSDTVFSQADHPKDGVARISDTAAILKQVSYDPQSKQVIGEAVILPTAKGKDLAAIIRAGGKVGISARGFGNTRMGESNGLRGDVVQEDYRLVTYDFVVGQSHKGAVVSSFEEQAQFLGEMEEEVDPKEILKQLTLESLKAERPDLVSAIESAVSHEAAIAEAVANKVKTLTVEDLKTARPDIVEAFGAKKMTCPECGAKFDAKAAEDAKDGGADDTTEQKREALLRSYCESKGLVLVPKDETSAVSKLEAEITTVKGQLTEVNTKTKSLEEQLTEANAKVTSLTEAAAKGEAMTYLVEKVKGQKFPQALTEDLKDCKTKAEIDAKFEASVAKIGKLMAEAQAPQPKGEAQPADGDDKKKIKTAAGEIEITEAQARQRSMAGLQG